MARVLLVMGHRNTSRNGTLGEASRTPLVVDAAARELRRAGHVVHVYQQIDGDGDPNFTHGTLTQVASGCGRAIKERGIDVMIDAHFQGSNTPTSGCFCIFPDGNLLKPKPAVDDGKVANQRSVAFAARLAEEVSRQTGIPRLALPEPGFLGGMSETQTRVGGDGDRLAMFRETVPPPRCVRVVMEHGDTVADATIIDSPGFYDRVAQAYVKAVNAFWPIVPASLEYFAFAEPQRFTAQAGAIGRRHASTDSDIVRRYTAGESIHCSGYYEAQEVSGDNRWLRAMGEESPRVHRSGVIEEIPPGTQTAPPAGTVGGVEGMPERDMAPGEEALARLEAMARPETLAEAAPSLDSVGCDMTFFVDEPVTSVG